MKVNEIYDFTAGIDEKLAELERRFVIDEDEMRTLPLSKQETLDFFRKYLWYPDMLIEFHEHYKRRYDIDKFHLEVTPDPESCAYYTIHINITLKPAYNVRFHWANRKYRSKYHIKYERDLLGDYHSFFEDAQDYIKESCVWIDVLATVW